MAAGALVPAGGAGGLGLGAFVLRKLGMPGRAIAIRSSVVFLVTSAVTVGALSLFGFGLATGVLAGPQKPLLTLLPALVGVLVIALFLAIPGPLAHLAEKHTEKHSRLASMVTSLAAGIRESEAVLRHPNVAGGGAPDRVGGGGRAVADPRARSARSDRPRPRALPALQPRERRDVDGGARPDDRSRAPRGRTSAARVGAEADAIGSARAPFPDPRGEDRSPRRRRRAYRPPRAGAGAR